MKKAAAAIIAVSMMLLCACGGGGFDPKKVSETYGAATELSAQIEVRTNFELIMDYSLSYKKSGGVAEVTILAPEVLSGITARLKEGECVLVYDGISVETLMPSIPGYSPADALHGLVEDLVNAVPLDHAYESIEGAKQIALTYSNPVEGYACEKRVWLDADTLAVSRCEYFVDGSLMMTMTVSSMALY